MVDLGRYSHRVEDLRPAGIIIRHESIQRNDAATTAGMKPSGPIVWRALMLLLLRLKATLLVFS